MQKFNYELAYIISIKYLEADMQKVIDQITKVIKDNGGKIVKEEILGKQKLAYPINHIHQGTYVIVEFDIDGVNLKKIDTELTLMNEVLRHLIVKKKVKSAEELQQEEAIRERLRKEKEDELKQIEEETKTAVQKSEEESVEKEIKIKKTDKKEDKKEEKVSLEDLDKKLDEILTDDIL